MYNYIIQIFKLIAPEAPATLQGGRVSTLPRLRVLKQYRYIHGGQ